MSKDQDENGYVCVRLCKAIGDKFELNSILEVSIEKGNGSTGKTKTGFVKRLGNYCRNKRVQCAENTFFNINGFSAKRV